MTGNDYRQRFLQKISDPTHPERLSADTLRFEQERVRFVLARFGLGKVATAIREINRRRDGQPVLTFAAFCERFQDFPFYLGCSRLRGLGGPWSTGRTGADYAVHTDPFSTEPARFKRFGAVPFVVAYRQFYEQVAATADARRVCLVFPRKGFLHGMCIHNDDTEQFWTRGLCWVYRFNDDGRDRRLYVQPFANLIDGVREVWRGTDGQD